MTFLDAVTSSLADLRLRNYSPKTLDSYGDQLRRFGEWLSAALAADLRRVSRVDVDLYQAYVRSESIGIETKALRLRAVKRLFDYLTASGKLLVHPAEHIVELRCKDRLPAAVLTVKQVAKLLAAPDTNRSVGVRDRALLETLYGTGIRVGELEQVHVSDVDVSMQTLTVRHGKGDRQRIVPLGQAASEWLKRYLDTVRPTLCRSRRFERTLFVVITGKPLTQSQIRAILRGYQRKCHLKKAVTPHALRHACATHLLQAGADIRLIQELLGHARLDSTAIYTRVVPLDLKTVHARYHPKEAGDAPR